MQENYKPSNPKDSIGITKAPLSTIPTPVLYEVGVAMMEGALKYRRHNYREAGVRASVYYDAAQRHLNSWWENEDIDPVSGINHISKAIAGLMVLRDAIMNDKFTDDRPPIVKNKQWMEDMNKITKELLDKYPNAPEPHTKGIK